MLVEPYLREALIRLNPEIAAQPDRADEVIYQLRAILLSVRSDGLVRANEDFTAWLRGEKIDALRPEQRARPRAPDRLRRPGQQPLRRHQPVHLPGRRAERRFDVVLLVNGMPLVIGEAKTPTRPARHLVRRRRSRSTTTTRATCPALFVPNVFSFATEGKTFRYGSIRMPLEMWGPVAGRATPTEPRASLREVRDRPCAACCARTCVLDILRNFTVFATDKKHRRIKIICRYQQYEAANKIVERVVAGASKKGLIWHFQGSGKSLLMVFAAQKLRLHPALGNPTVLIVVDRIDLDTQITGHLQRRRRAQHGRRRQPRGAADAAGAGRAQDHHHHHPQVRRGRAACSTTATTSS